MHKGETRTRVKTKGLSGWMAEMAWQRQQAEDLAGSRREGVHRRRVSQSEQQKHQNQSGGHPLAPLIQITEKMVLE